MGGRVEDAGVGAEVERSSIVFVFVFGMEGVEVQLHGEASWPRTFSRSMVWVRSTSVVTRNLNNNNIIVIKKKKEANCD